jgi:hypothetical protein
MGRPTQCSCVRPHKFAGAFPSLFQAKEISSPERRWIADKILDCDSRKCDSRIRQNTRRASGTPFRGPFSFADRLLFLVFAPVSGSGRFRRASLGVEVQVTKPVEHEFCKFGGFPSIDRQRDSLVIMNDLSEIATVDS